MSGSSQTAARLGLFSATAIVVANIIGTGIFTTTGFQAASIPSPFAILLIWLLGGVLAICGALCYGELASAMPRSGGEYTFLSQLYHPSLGFLAGFVSLVAGFSVPVAAAAMAFGKYASAVMPALNDKACAALLILAITALHGFSLTLGSRIQNVFTVAKILLILGFGLSGLLVAQPQEFSLVPGPADWDAVLSAGFAIGLVYVSFAYSGWNAAAYISGEISNPRRNVPLALLGGTAIVIVLYLLTNFAYLTAAPLSALAGQAEVGDVAARFIFGDVGGRIVSTLIALALVSSVSSMVMAGPRVMHAMGQDVPAFAFLGKTNAKGLPVNALALQAGIALVTVFVSELRETLNYIGFTLSLFAFLSVAGVFILRWQQKKAGVQYEGYRTFGYPLTPLIFMGLSAWMFVYQLKDNLRTNLAVLATLVLGLVAWFLLSRKRK